MTKLGSAASRCSVICFSALGTFLLLVAGCGGGGAGSGGGNGGGGGGGTSSNAPVLTGIAPSTTLVGAPAITIVAYGSNFVDGAAIEWNGVALTSSCVEANVTLQAPCATAVAVTASIPASDFTSAGNATVTVSNPQPAGGTSSSLKFTVSAAPAASTWARTVPGITVPWNEVWDSAHGKLYVSVASQDPAAPNTIAVIDPVAGKIGTSVAAGDDPHFLSLSSDSSYLWMSLDGSSSVQRFLLPGLSTDVSFPVPSFLGFAQHAVSMEAAPVSPHAIALVAGGADGAEGGNGVYVYDDATMRPNYEPGDQAGGPEFDWIQWGKDDSTIYATQTVSEGGSGIWPLQVNSSGLSWNGTGGGLTASLFYYDNQNGLAYSWDGITVYDPVLETQVGQFDVPEPDTACTADSVLGRYYCVVVYSIGGVDVYATELWVFDLNTYALLNRVYFGALQGESGASQPNSTITGAPRELVRWGNAGLALITTSGAEYGIPISESPYGAGGVFLIDGAAVNPNAAPDVAAGSTPSTYPWLSSLSPQAATTASGDVTVTIDGTGFSPDSTACWNCSFLQFQFLPTSYVSATKLSVTIPVAQLGTTGPIAISVFDQSANLFSSNALTFSIPASSGSTQITPLNLTGLAMTWDTNSQLLYVGTSDSDGAYPNSIVAVNGANGTIVKSRPVSPDPDILSDGADGQFIYATFATTTNMTQFTLPGLEPTVTWRLKDPHYGITFLAGDMKAAPVNPHTTAVTLFSYGSTPRAQGGVAIFDDGVERPIGLPGWTEGQVVPALYDVLAWGNTDSILSSAENDNIGDGPLFALDVNASGVSYGTQNPSFNSEYSEIHSDFGTGLVYSDNGLVADPTTAATIGSYNASGLVAPDSSLNRTFILGQVADQANTNSFTIESFDEKAFTQVSSITLDNLAGSPIQLVRWGASGLALLTSGGVPGVYENSFGMLYLIEDPTFVSNAAPAPSAKAAKQELVQQRWKRLSKKEILGIAHNRMRGRQVAGSELPEN